jgi:hypothetical protein
LTIGYCTCTVLEYVIRILYSSTMVARGSGTRPHPEAGTVHFETKSAYNTNLYSTLMLQSGIRGGATDCLDITWASVLRPEVRLLLWDGAGNSATLLLHHGLNSFCPEPTCALCMGVLSHRITCAYYQPHTKSQSIYFNQNRTPQDTRR